MTKRINSQKTMLNHSQAKVRLLGRYLDRYFNIISNAKVTERIHVFDLFCGEGVYENGEKGSPFIILDAAKRLHNINSGKIPQIPPINIYLNDKSDSKIQKVRSEVEKAKAHNEGFGKLYYSKKDYKDVVPGLVSFTERLQREKAFIFIDPYGYKDISITEIKDLLKCKKTEVLLFLPTQFMYRFDESGTPESLIKLLDDLVSYENWKTNDSVFHFIKQFKEGLKNSLGDEFFVDTFTIQKDPQTVFCLFFFSSHIRGFEKMLETKWEIDTDEGKGWKYERSGNLFASFKTNSLEEKLLIFLAEGCKNNKEIYSFTLHNGFLPKHVNEVLSSLQISSRIMVVDSEGEKARKGAFYVSYKHYKEDLYRIIVKLI